MFKGILKTLILVDSVYGSKFKAELPANKIQVAAGFSEVYFISESDQSVLRKIKFTSELKVANGVANCEALFDL